MIENLDAFCFSFDMVVVFSMLSFCIIITGNKRYVHWAEKRSE
jgi:hypothetical protein